VSTQRIEKYAEFNNQKSEDLMEQMKDWANITDPNSKRGDKFTQKDKLGMLKTDRDI